ncbi:hypothetical protein KBX50_08265 [Micromonospora sp. C51]|uniref:hypothetical protein n=1 Tax=Micromonospora sp. C51 TaxID=2824879 RepID=UPI001B380B87|nr:hypothetical protein [Micromonospora sp. C51]MBQ1048458.1 hypothetical protein [Micromonospora sp. C51]
MRVISATEVEFTTPTEIEVADRHAELLNSGLSYEGAVERIENGAREDEQNWVLQALAEPKFRTYLSTGSPELAADARRQPASVPELKGERTSHRDGRYRVYTREHLPFDALPEGHPGALVSLDWSVAVTREGRCGEYTYAVGAVRLVDGKDLVQHALEGTPCESYRDGYRIAYEAGLLGFMVYEYDAARYGLPTVADATA